MNPTDAQREIIHWRNRARGAEAERDAAREDQEERFARAALTGLLAHSGGVFSDHEEPWRCARKVIAARRRGRKDENGEIA